MRKLIYLHLFMICFSIAGKAGPETWIRINQVGYLPDDRKVAVLLSQEESGEPAFVVKEASTGKVVWEGEGIRANGERWGMHMALRLPFTGLTHPGEYYIESN